MLNHKYIVFMFQCYQLVSTLILLFFCVIFFPLRFNLLLQLQYLLYLMLELLPQAGDDSVFDFELIQEARILKGCCEGALTPWEIRLVAAALTVSMPVLQG